jgi:hypothetical protein
MRSVDYAPEQWKPGSFCFYLFNDEVIRDLEGAQFANVSAAVTAAERMARGMAAESVRQGHLILHHRIDVADELGKTVETVRYRDVVEIQDGLDP